LAQLHDTLGLGCRDAEQAELRLEDAQHAQGADGGRANAVAGMVAALAVEGQAEMDLLHGKVPGQSAN
jgi:hypothetical protein